MKLLFKKKVFKRRQIKRPDVKYILTLNGKYKRLWNEGELKDVFHVPYQQRKINYNQIKTFSEKC